MYTHCVSQQDRLLLATADRGKIKKGEEGGSCECEASVLSRVLPCPTKAHRFLWQKDSITTAIATRIELPPLVQLGRLATPFSRLYTTGPLNFPEGVQAPYLENVLAIL